VPAQYSLPPDTRAVGTGNPPADMNAVVDALTATGAAFNVLNSAFAGGADPTGVSDSTAAFQAAITAAQAVGGTVVVPAGTYKGGASSLSIPSAPFRFTGAGRTGTVINWSGNTMFNNTAANLPAPGYEFDHFTVNMTGGDIFHNMGLNGGTWHDLSLVQNSGGNYIFVTQGNNSLLNCTFSNIDSTTTAPVLSVPPWRMESSAGGALSNNTFYRIRHNNLGYDSTQFMFRTACTGSGSFYQPVTVFRDCWFEHPYGGAVQSLSGMGHIIEGCMLWDVLANGPATTVAAGSNGGQISNIATWGAGFGGSGVLQVASTTGGTGFPAFGTLTVATSTTTATITYTGLTPTSFTGCAYVSGSATGTVATGGAVQFPVTAGNSMFYFGAYPGNAGSMGVRVIGCGFNLGGGGVNGTTSWHVECESTTNQILIESFCNYAASGGGASHIYFNFHGCQDVVLTNNLTPFATNGLSQVIVTNPGTSQITIGQGLIRPIGGVLGDGSDGNVTLDGSVTVPWATKAGSVYTMTRDALLTNLVINNTVTLTTAGFRVFCQATISNIGTINNNGAAAAGSAGGAGSSSGSTRGGTTGGAGGTGVSGAGGNATALTSPGAGAGGNGGAGTSGAAGTGGTVSNAAQTSIYRSMPGQCTGQIAAASFNYAGGTGGGGGGSDAGSHAGGGGGGGGGMIMLIAQQVINTGTISATGGAGAAASLANAGGGGGGGGGVILVYTMSAWTAGSTAVTGGALGGGLGTGANGVAGGNGTVLNVILN
jgi:hypothetical protein